MRKKIPVSVLTIGMHVNMSLPWYSHPFLKDNFTIVSENQISKIYNLGLPVVTIDTDMGIDVPMEEASSTPVVHPQVEAPIILDSLMEAIHATSLPAPEKATIIHEHSITMMRQLLDNPSVENIRTVKKGIAEVVNIILREDTTTQYLLRISSHDFSTYTHSVTVGVLGVAMAKSMFGQSDGHDMHELGAGFFLHDLGKVHIDQSIINKPGKLTDEEMNSIKCHPMLGYRILSETGQLTEECKLIVLQHHERDDGNGYPQGLKGEDIHIYGRICAIADVYDALSSDRPYREIMSPYNALLLMRDEMLTHFKRDLFKQFVMLFKEPLGRRSKAFC